MCVAVFLVISLGLALGAPGLVGLAVLLLLTTFMGVVDPEALGQAFTEALPFAALIVVFFVVAGMIDEQGLFRGLVQSVLGLSGKSRMVGVYFADAILSSVSDSVFVAAVYINEVYSAYTVGQLSRSDLNLLAVAITVSTNIAAIATPNGQAAFLFLLTSRLSPLLKISYFNMAWMCLPYTISLTLSSFLIVFFLPEFTESFVAAGWLDSV